MHVFENFLRNPAFRPLNRRVEVSQDRLGVDREDGMGRAEHLKRMNHVPRHPARYVPSIPEHRLPRMSLR